MRMKILTVKMNKSEKFDPTVKYVCEVIAAIYVLALVLCLIEVFTGNNTELKPWIINNAVMGTVGFIVILLFGRKNPTLYLIYSYILALSTGVFVGITIAR